MSILAWIVVGLIAGVVAKALMPGKEPGGIIVTVLLGIGGARMLQALGYTAVERFHMNEGHAAFLTLQLLRESTPVGSTEWDFPAVRRRCVFTTHTPLPAGHDQFAYDLVRRVMGDLLPLEVLQMLGGPDRLVDAYMKHFRKALG